MTIGEARKALSKVNAADLTLADVLRFSDLQRSLDICAAVVRPDYPVRSKIADQVRRFERLAKGHRQLLGGNGK